MHRRVINEINTDEKYTPINTMNHSAAQEENFGFTSIHRPTTLYDPYYDQSFLKTGFSSKILYRNIIIRVFTILLFFGNSVASAQSLIVDKKKFFTDEPILEMTLVADFRKLINEKLRKDYKTNFLPATITCLFTDSFKVTEEIAIRARGEFRRGECYMPPIMVSFKSPNKGVLNPLGRLKLVWPCGGSKYDEQLLLKEYLVYKIYNLLTEKSFRVRLVKMGYQDIKGKLKSQSRYSFFIEDVDEMAKRNNCVEIESKVYHTQSTAREQTTLLSLFQYMVGNIDWAVPVYKNLKLMRNISDTFTVPIIVPYDFDYCGLVNASYAVPPPELSIISIRQRVYRGFPRSMKEVQSALQIFRRQRQHIDSLVKNFELLTPDNRKDMINYLDGFFEQIEKEKEVMDIFIVNARKH